MKLRNTNPKFGLSILHEGRRFTCEPGGFIEMRALDGRALLKKSRSALEEVKEPKIPAPEKPAAPKKEIPKSTAPKKVQEKGKK